MLRVVVPEVLKDHDRGDDLKSFADADSIHEEHGLLVEGVGDHPVNADKLVPTKRQGTKLAVIQSLREQLRVIPGVELAGGIDVGLHAVNAWKAVHHSNTEMTTECRWRHLFVAFGPFLPVLGGVRSKVDSFGLWDALVCSGDDLINGGGEVPEIVANLPQGIANRLRDFCITGKA